MMALSWDHKSISPLPRLVALIECTALHSLYWSCRFQSPGQVTVYLLEVASLLSKDLFKFSFFLGIVREREKWGPWIKILSHKTTSYALPLHVVDRVERLPDQCIYEELRQSTQQRPLGKQVFFHISTATQKSHSKTMHKNITPRQFTTLILERQLTSLGVV